jgi:hypothetical protein
LCAVRGGGVYQTVDERRIGIVEDLTGSAGIGGRLGPVVIFHRDDEDRFDGVGMDGAG